jgi:hypothetical protein
MDLGYNIILMEISIKVVGNKIKDMDKVLTGYLIPKINLEGNILVIGKMIKSREEELCFTKSAIDMMECGWIICLMERVE